MQPSNYGPFPYSPIIDRPPLRWPNGARLALWVIPNIEFFSLQDRITPQSGPVPDVPAWAVRDYGNRIGVFRLMRVLEKHGIRGTVALNSDLCAQHPRIIEEAMRLGWELMGHNQTNTKRLNAVPPEQESALIQATLETIQAASGTRPFGWLGSGLQETWHTLDHLAEQGCLYVADWVNDDQPYVMTLESGRTIVSVPYSTEINDKPAYDRYGYSATEFRDMICRQFDVLYEEGADSGRVMAICLHPYLSGMPHRIKALDDALADICKHPGVWKATGTEIARAYLEATR